MDFQTAVRTCLSRYATFQGRAQRSEFWWFYLFILIVDLAVAVLDSALDAGGILSGVIQLLFLLPSLAVGARRLHDIGRSGWWQLIGVVPLVGLIALLYWWTRPTQPGANAYGDAPRPARF